MKRSLTPRQLQFYTAIQEYIRLNNEPPSSKYLADKFDVSESAVSQILNILVNKEVINKGGKWERKSLQVANKVKKTINVPIVGNVACGLPLLAEENIQGYLPVDKELIKNSQKYFFLRAIGDSMDQAKINDGDYLLIQKQPTANNNEIVVALIDDEATVKVLKKEKDVIALLPKSSNKIHAPIILDKDFSIQGIVKKIIPGELIEE